MIRDASVPVSPALAALSRVDFDWTTHIDSIWRDLPYDVPELHATVRAELASLLERLHQAPTNASPLGVALIGPAGSGKTHLLSALRRQALAQGALFVLVDMTDVHDFWETVLLGFIRSLLQPSASGRAQHQALLAHLIELAGTSKITVELLRSARPPGLMNRCSEVIAGLRRSDPRLIEHQDVVRSLILLASDDLDLQDLGYKWLQGVGIDDDEKLHHGFAEARRSPIELVRGLSYVAGLQGRTLLALDQLDAIVAEQQPFANLASGASTVAPPADELAAPSQAVATALGIIQGIARGLSALRDTTRRTQTVLSCLEQTWRVLERRAVVSMVDRFLPPTLLRPLADSVSGQRLVEMRLAPAYAAVAFVPPYPTYPFPPAFFARHAGASPRELLKACDEHRTSCLRSGAVTEAAASPGPDSNGGIFVGPGRDQGIEAVRHEFQRLCAHAEAEQLLAREDEETLDTLLEAACLALVAENPLPDDVDAQVEHDFLGTGSFEPLHARVRLIYRAEGDREKHLAVRFLQKAHHRAFQARLKAAITASGIDQQLGFRQLVLFRRGPAPGGEGTARLLQELKLRAGRLVEPTPSEMAALWALARMVRDVTPSPSVMQWLRTDRPVSTMEVFRPCAEYLFGDLSHRAGGAPKGPPAGAGLSTTKGVGEATPTPTVILPGPKPAGLFIGRKLVGQVQKEPLEVPLENLVKHSVVLAGAGSGKTVLVRRIVEEAALLGVPSIVVDVANDLARLGDAWPAPPAAFDATDLQKARRYHAAAEVVVWTPGRQEGNPLVLDPLPNFAAVKDTADELQAALDMARASLEPIAGVVKGVLGKVKSGLLASVLRYFAAGGGGSLKDLLALLVDLPPEANGGFDKADKLARDLANAIRAEIETNALLRGEGAALDPAALLRSNAPGKTRISVVNLSGLPSLGAQQQLVNQLAMTLFTWIRKNPAKGRVLQGLLVIDEARDFVPATSSVPGKESLIRLAAQARKYGLGLVFATQAPKSIDHNVIANCSTQLFGRTNSPAAIATVQEQLQQRNGSGKDVATLPRGCFYVYTEGLTAPQKIQAPLCLSHHPDSPPDEQEVVALALKSREAVGYALAPVPPSTAV